MVGACFAELGEANEKVNVTSPGTLLGRRPGD